MGMTEIQCMLDGETLSTKMTAAVVSIGAVKFTVDDGIIDRFKVNICAKSCKEHGLHFSKDTIDWWAKQPKEAREAWQKDPVSLPEALSLFNEWYGTKSITTWAKGAKVFDIPILENAYAAAGLTQPWRYPQIADYRTLLLFCNVDDRKLKEAGTVAHDALTDCEQQVKVLLPLLKAIQ